MKTLIVARAFLWLTLLLSFFNTAPCARGTTFISTVGQTNLVVLDGTEFGWQTGTGFISGSSATTLHAAQLLVYNEDSVDHSYALEIWTGINQPGTFMAIFDNTPVAGSDGPNPTTLNFVSAAGISLAAGTTYWVVAHTREANATSVPTYSVTLSGATDAGSVFTLESPGDLWITTDGMNWYGNNSGYLRYSLSGAVTAPPAPDLTNLTVKNGALQMTLINLAPGATNVLQISTNLQSWVSVQTNVASGSTLSFTNNINPAIRSQFFRAIIN